MSSHIFVGTAATRPDSIGGLFRSTAGGKRFELLDNGIPTTTGVQAITVHPDDSSLIFVATRNGVFRTKDSGDSWTQLNVPLDKRQAWSVIAHPTQPSTIVVGSSPIGFFRSDDMGETWRELQGPSNLEYFENLSFKHSRTMRITIDPVQTNLWYAAAEIAGVFTSTDGGETWSAPREDLIRLARTEGLGNRELTEDDDEGMLDGHAVNVSPARPGVVYYSCRMGLFTSSDAGQHWKDLGIGKFSQWHYSRDIRVSPADPKTLYTCLSINSRSDRGTLWKSRDLGETWAQMDTPLTTPDTIMSMGIDTHDGEKVYAVTRHGQVLSTRDAGKSWGIAQLPYEAGDAFCVAGN